jgi:hypothetical protein
VLEKKLKELVEANIEKIVHVREKQDEINALKDQQKAVEMASQEELGKTKLDELTVENAELKAEIDKLRMERDKLVVENEELRKQIEALEKEHSDHVKYVEEQYTRLEEKIGSVEEIVVENDNLREENLKLKEGEKEHFAQLAYADRTILHLEAEKTKLEKLKDKLEEEREKFKESEDGYRRHIEYLEKSLEEQEVQIEEQKVAIIEKDNDIKKKDRLTQDFHDSQERSGKEFKHYGREITTLTDELAKARKEIEALKEEVRDEKRDALTARNELDNHMAKTRDQPRMLERKLEEVRRLNAELDPLKEKLKGMEELQLECNNARQTVASLSAVIEKLQKGQNPEFKQGPDAYRGPDTSSVVSVDESVDGGDDGDTAVLKKKRSLDDELSSAAGDHESHYSEEPIDKKGKKHERGPRNAFTQFIFKTVQIGVPGPQVVVEVPTPGPEVPVAGPTRYVPFRVWAHHPVVCWLLVEYNFLMLAIYWIGSGIALGKRLGRKILGRAAAPASPWLSDASESSEAGDLDGDGVRFPPRRDSSLRLQRGLWGDLLRPRPGRLPSVVDTLVGLSFHILVYAAVWMSYSAYQERQLWLAANDATRRYLYQILHNHQSDGFLGLRQLVPRGFQRKFVQWRFVLFMKAGVPVTYRFPG